MALAQAGVERPKGRSAPNGDGIDDHANHVMADTAPVECTGPAGTVVLWHVMALHAAGINRTPGTIRKSVILGIGRIVALYDRSSASYQIH